MPHGPMPKLSYGCTKCNYWTYDLVCLVYHRKNLCKGFDLPVDYVAPPEAYIVTGTLANA